MATFTEEDLIQFQQIFKLFDRDGDGLLRLDDIRKVMQIFNRGISDLEISNLLSELDPTGSGAIDLQKFITLMANEVPAENEKDLLDSFKFFDRDNNGVISLSDMKILYTNLCEKGTDEELENMLMEADYDGDEALNFDEYIRALKAT
eukprot:TRINITY_DN4464_c0_g1_i1.p1 TRINITY_DN4464_c0_g1~~TRINITY_DN4464_c0_g1_i1.p1  ORF type:complete len:148 (+),score=56.50 TRINITY_DN4464_c0_g1_i1:100-543(+)